MKCENCNIEHDGSWASGRFCTSKCSKKKRQEINEKIRLKLTKFPQLDYQTLIDAVREVNSWCSLGKYLQVGSHSGARSHLKKQIENYQISTTHFWKPFTLEQRFTKNVPKRRLKDALISVGRRYQCEICLQQSMWQNKPLTLQIDHINGDNRDHTIENLRFLCPNCHTQTPTYGSKKRI